MNTSPELDKLSPALAKAQGVIEGAAKAKENPHFRSKYADLAACWDACREELTSNGISVIQALKPSVDGITVQTRLQHSSGQFVEDDGLFLPATKHDAQGFGSALTYARRYGLCAMVGIAPEDDDGNAAAKSAPKKAPSGSGAGFLQECFDGLPKKRQNEIVAFALDTAALLTEGRETDAYIFLEELGLDDIDKSALWSRLDSKQRSTIKSAGESYRTQQALEKQPLNERKAA